MAHEVFFTLSEDTAENRAHLVRECETKLSDLPGIAFFAAGTRDESIADDPNDLEFHVSLHIYFEDKASYEAYLIAPPHVAFVEENKASWANVRVFDSQVMTY